jgi:hypothetical protein
MKRDTRKRFAWRSELWDKDQPSMRWFTATFVVVLLLTSGACRSGDDASESKMTVGSTAGGDSGSPFRNLGKRDEAGS